MSIKAGYRITVDSWENDGDNSRTLSVDGIQDKEYVAFIVDCLKLLESNGKFGNMYEPDDSEWEEYIEALKVVCDKHGASKFFIGNPNFVQGFEPHEYVTNIIYAYHGSSEYYANRVTESIKVEYIPTDIVIEDVTKEFV